MVVTKIFNIIKNIIILHIASAKQKEMGSLRAIPECDERKSQVSGWLEARKQGNRKKPSNASFLYIFALEHFMKIKM